MQETHAQVTAPAEQVLYLGSKFREALLHTPVTLALPFAHHLFTSWAQRARGAAIYEMCWHAQQLSNIFHHRQEIPRSLLKHQILLLPRQSRHMQREVTPKCLGFCILQLNDGDSRLPCKGHEPALAIRLSAKFTPWTLPMRDHYQERPTTLVGNPPDAVQQALRFTVDPLCIVKPQNGRKSTSTIK